MWDVATGQPLGGTLQHTGAIDSVAFSADGHAVVVVSNDGTSGIWRVLLDLRSGDDVERLADAAELLGGYRVTDSSALFPCRNPIRWSAAYASSVRKSRRP